jgi:nickel transport protein
MCRHPDRLTWIISAIIVGLAWILAIPVAQAHALHLFATVSGRDVQGKTYYADGPAPGISVTVYGTKDEVLGTVETDEAGMFTWTPTIRSDLRFVTETVDGHRTEFTVTASELPETLPAPEGEMAGGESDGFDRSDRSVGSTEAPGSSTELQHLIEDAVSRQIAPLREQLDAAGRHTQFRDIVGGIGYIVGVAGLLVLWKRRSNPSGR